MSIAELLKSIVQMPMHMYKHTNICTQA